MKLFLIVTYLFFAMTFSIDCFAKGAKVSSQTLTEMRQERERVAAAQAKNAEQEKARSAAAQTEMERSINTGLSPG